MNLEELIPAKVFVYGTLKSGYGNNRLLQNKGATLLGEAVTDSAYTLLQGGIPFAVRNGEKPILGELYEVTDPNVMRNLDALEGNGSFYTRHQRRMMLLGTGEELEGCWIYEIPEGDRYGNQLAPTVGVNEHSIKEAFCWGR